MTPRINDVGALESYDPQDFRFWLTRGFRDYRHPSRASSAFAPVSAFVGHDQDPTIELQAVYRLLSGTAQENLCRGLGMAIADLKYCLDDLPLIKELLHFVGRINAIEALPAVLTQVGSGPFGRPDYPETAEIFAFALGIVAGMAPAHGIADALRHLADRPSFVSDYAPTVFIALCRSEPGRFPEHLTVLRNHFDALHQRSGTVGTQITARRFAHYVSLDMIAASLYRLTYSLDQQREPWRWDNWLVDSLFTGERPPLRLMPRLDGGAFGPGPVHDSLWITHVKRQPATAFPVNLPVGHSDRSLALACSLYLNRLIARLSQAETPAEIGAKVDAEQRTKSARHASAFRGPVNLNEIDSLTVALRPPPRAALQIHG
jgi:hypothetical protein